jgi:hypothetical protein
MMDPELISRTLCMVPTWMWKAGDRRATPVGSPPAGIYEESYWTCRLHSEPSYRSTDVDFALYLEQQIKSLFPIGHFSIGFMRTEEDWSIS